MDERHAGLANRARALEYLLDAGMTMHARLRFTYIVGARVAGYIAPHPYCDWLEYLLDAGRRVELGVR